MKYKTFDNTTEKVGEELKKDLQKDSKVAVAAAIFSIYGFESLKEELSQISEMRFIFTDPMFVEQEKQNREQKLFEIRSNKQKQALGGTEFEINLKNELKGRAIAKECRNWIEEKVRFKSNQTLSGIIQSQMVIENDEESSVYMNINDFSSAGFGYEHDGVILRSSSKIQDYDFARQYLDNFNRVWNDSDSLKDVTNEVVDYITNLYQENSPEFIYYLTLFHIFDEFLEDITEEEIANERTGFKNSVIWNTMYDFQQDAVLGIINKLEKFNGCILADSVGLGKTFTALGVMKYYQERNKSILVLCPKKLGDNWQTYLANYEQNILYKDRFNYDILYHTDLSRDYGYSAGNLDLGRINWGNYDLVVIDESHNFRNAGRSSEEGKKSRYEKLLEDVMQAGVKTKVLMLSATPVNNRFTDLKNQLALAYEGQTDQIDERIDPTKSIETILSHAQKVFNDWAELPITERTSQELLRRLTMNFEFFRLLDSLTIARSRKHIEKYYDMDQIGRFPTRLKPISIHSDITDLPDFMKISDLAERLMSLHLAVYNPTSYILHGKRDYYAEMYDTKLSDTQRFDQETREGNLKTLMMINLLKRLESSVYSFRRTLSKLDSYITTTIEKIDRFEEYGSYGLAGFDFQIVDDPTMDVDEEWDDELSVGAKVKIKLEDMNTAGWKHDLLEDQGRIRVILSEMKRVTPDRDLKLTQLKEYIHQKVAQPINEQNKKVLIFTTFADTAQYLYDNLAPMIESELGLHVAKITGSGTNQSTMDISSEFNRILTNFSPISKKRLAKYQDAPQIDILIATDCISEGQNLQDCDTLVNYDIHWNPVRIIQRFGRVDRIGSINEKIQLVNFWPQISLDEYINLKTRVETRMAMVDLTATGEDDVLTNKSSEMEFRKEQLERLQHEVVDLEDMDSGISITDLGLNDFRMDLVSYLKEHGNVFGDLPTGMHTVCKADPQIGAEPGVIYVLKNRRNELNINNINQLHPFYLVYIKEDGEVLINHLAVKKTLDILRAVSKGYEQPISDVFTTFNQETDDGRNMRKYSELLDQSIASIITVKDETDIGSLFRPGGTTVSKGKVQGLEDFELISFIVVK